MTTLEWIVLAGVIAVIFGFDAVRREIASNAYASRSADDVESDMMDLQHRLESIDNALRQIEEHTARVAEPLYDQDAFDRKHLVGKYDPDRLIDELDSSYE